MKFWFKIASTLQSTFQATHLLFFYYYYSCCFFSVCDHSHNNLISTFFCALVSWISIESFDYVYGVDWGWLRKRSDQIYKWFYSELIWIACTSYTVHHVGFCLWRQAERDNFALSVGNLNRTTDIIQNKNIDDRRLCICNMLLFATKCECVCVCRRAVVVIRDRC